MKLQFGSYELDPENGALRKHGIGIRLREQAIQVLIALLERPGDLVTRDELRRRLWRDGTVVDFEVGLNTAISRLRRALNDPVRSSRFIETVPKRGYRFVGSIAKQPSLAVMPFVGRGLDQEGEYFCSGLTEELISTCWRIEGIRVAGHATVSRFRDQPYNPTHAARELGVDAILEGSIRRMPDLFRVNLHLIDGQDGFEIWSERFDVDPKSLFNIAEHVTAQVAEVLRVRLRPPERGSRTGSTEAYTAYLKGHYLVKRHSTANSAKALEYFEQAMQADPGYSLAYHGAAVVYILDTLLGLTAPCNGFEKAEALLGEGLAIQTDSAMLQNTLGMLRMFQWRWEESEEAYRRAIVLEPLNPHPHMMFALHQSFSGRHRDARREAQTALDLDPVDPMMNFRVVQAHYYARDYEAAIASARSAIDLAPEFHPPYGYMTFALLAAERREEAWSIAQRSRLLGQGRPFCEGQFGYVAGRIGQIAAARAAIADLEARRRRGYCAALPIAWAWLGLGDVGSCLKWMQTALHEREPYLAAAAVAPMYDPLRSDANFTRLLQSIGLMAVVPAETD